MKAEEFIKTITWELEKICKVHAIDGEILCEARRVPRVGGVELILNIECPAPAQSTTYVETKKEEAGTTEAGRLV